MKIYTVRVAREGKWWMVHVPEIDGLTQARRCSEVAEMARSLIAVSLDVDPGTFDTRTELEAIDDIKVDEAIEQIQQETKTAQELQDKARAETRQLATRSADYGAPLRDIGS
jgi:hypothetical protein